METSSRNDKQIDGNTRRGSRLALLATMIFGLASAASAQVPAIVATSQAPITTTTTIPGGKTATDACGNVYVNPSGNGDIVRIAAGSGTVTTVSANNNGYNGGKGLAVDAAKANLYFPTSSQWYSSQFTQVPITNCNLGGKNTFATNFGSLGIYYFGTADSIAADAAGNVFFIATCCNNGLILEESAAGVASKPQSSWPNYITSLAVDAADNLYFLDGSANVYLLKAPYTATAAALGGSFTKPVGLSFDSQGNLLVADGSASNLYEIPNEGGTLNPAHQFQVVANTTFVDDIATDTFGNIYLSNGNGAPVAIRQSAALLPSTALGSTSAAAAVNYVFNASVTPATINVVTGAAASSTFTQATGGCAAGTTYTAGQSCSVNVTFTPSAAGQQRAAVVLANSSGTTLNTAFLRGTGLAPAISIDPGTVTALGSGFKSPSGIAVGPDGTTYVIDATANTLTSFAPGSTTGTVVGTGSLTLSNPSAVSVDSAGDIYIADTGNNRIVEVPVVKGVLTPASSVAFTAGLKAPTGLVVGGGGNLFVADTGNARMLFVPTQGGIPNFAGAQPFGSGFSAPSAVTIDPNGDVFVADAGTGNAVYEFVAPLGSQAGVKVVTGLSNPTGVAADSSGSLFVADKGSASVFRYPNNAGILGTRTVVSNGVLNPLGIATDIAGNLYVTDSVNSVVNQLQRVKASVLFGGVNVGSTGIPSSASVNASGNQPVTFPSPSYTVNGNTAAGFAVTSDGCASATVAVGGACTITASFTPPVTELNAEEDLTLLGNATLGGPRIALIGTGANIKPSTLTLALTAPTSGTINAGSPVTFTATLSTGASTVVPGGSVKFSVNGTQVGTIKLTAGAAALTLPNGLPKGTVTITAVYSGDVINYGGSSATLTQTVNALPDTVTMLVGTPSPGYINPQTANEGFTPILDSNGNQTGATYTAPIITLTTTVAVAGQIIPGGTVTFYQGSTANSLGVASVGTGGVAQITTTALRAGTNYTGENNSSITTYNLFSVYSGDQTYAPVTSATSQLTVVAAPPLAGSGLPGTPKETTGATFTITPTSPSITIASTNTGPSSGVAVLNVTSYGGWAGVLNFTCTGLPQYATCAPYPGAPLIAASSGSNAASNQIQFIINTNVAPIVSTANSFAWWMAGITGLLLLIVRRRFAGSALRSIGSLTGLVLLLASTMAALNGCSANMASTTPFVTPSGTSKVTVTLHAAQVDPSKSDGTVLIQDVNPGSFQVTLSVK